MTHNCIVWKIDKIRSEEKQKTTEYTWYHIICTYVPLIQSNPYGHSTQNLPSVLNAHIQ